MTLQYVLMPQVLWMEKDVWAYLNRGQAKEIEENLSFILLEFAVLILMRNAFNSLKTILAEEFALEKEFTKLTKHDDFDTYPFSETDEVYIQKDEEGYIMKYGHGFVLWEIFEK